MSKQVLSPFEEQLTLALASNTEFIKQAVSDYNQKVTGYCVALQIKQTIEYLSNGE
jgi:hypothetical protein